MVVQLLQVVGDQLLEFDLDTRERFAQLAGKVVAIAFTGLDRQLYLEFQEQQVAFHEHWDGAVHLTLRGSLGAFVRFTLVRGTAEFTEGDFQIEGDAALAQQVAKVLKQLDIDWEELLSRYVGDIAAHQLSAILKDLYGWARDTADTLQRDIAEYLVEERRVLAHHERVQAFLKDVDVLRGDVERFELRLQRVRNNCL